MVITKLCCFFFLKLSSRLLTILSRNFQIAHHCTYGETKKTSIIWKASGRRAKWSEILDSNAVEWTWMHYCDMVILESFGALCDFFRKCEFQNTTSSTNCSRNSNFPWIIFSILLTNDFGDFLNFENLNLNDFFFVFVNMGPNRSEKFKALTLLQTRAAETFLICPEFSPEWSSRNYVGNFWNFEFPSFN